MESKIRIDIDEHRQERILIQLRHSDDVPDKLLAMLLQTAIPDGGGWRIRDGYCRVSILSVEGNGVCAEIVPIHPIDMPKHLGQISENAGNWATDLPAKRPYGWLNALEHPLADEQTAAARKAEGTGYEYSSFAREGSKVFIGEETCHELDSESLREWEWLNEK